MRSMSISGSSWNSLIFTVSDKILFRFLSSSSTYNNIKLKCLYFIFFCNLSIYSVFFRPVRVTGCSAFPRPPLHRREWCGVNTVSAPPGSRRIFQLEKQETWWPAFSPLRSSEKDKNVWLICVSWIENTIVIVLFSICSSINLNVCIRSLREIKDSFVLVPVFPDSFPPSRRQPQNELSIETTPE